MKKDDRGLLAILGIILVCGGVAVYFSDSIADALSRRAMERWAQTAGLGDRDQQSE